MDSHFLKIKDMQVGRWDVQNFLKNCNFIIIFLQVYYVIIIFYVNYIFKRQRM